MNRYTESLIEFILILLLLAPINVFADEHEHEGGNEHKHHDQENSKEQGEHEEHEGHEAHGEEHESKPTEFSAEILKQSGITVEKPSRQRINVGLKLNGRILADEDRVVHVIARFPGIVKRVHKKLGDTVKKDEVLAVIESNQSLQPYELTSLVSGTVVKRHASVGEFVAESSEIFILADLSHLVVDLFVFEPDFLKVKIGQKVEIAVPHLEESHSSTISFVSSVVEESTQSKFVRAELDNSDGHFYPGQFVSGTLVLEEVEVPLAIRNSAIQTIEGRDVVFVTHGKHFEAKEVQVGRRDSQWSEVLSGLNASDEYASGNTFIIKAELGKSEAEHEH